MTDLEVLRAALYEAARAVLDDEKRSARPDTYFMQQLRLDLFAIKHSTSIEALATVDWITAMAAKGIDQNRYGPEIPNLEET